MSTLNLVEFENVEEVKGLAPKILDGTVAVFRNGLQKLGLMNMLVDAGTKGIRDSVGSEMCDQIMASGFERIHEHVGPGEIPELTDAVYARFKEINLPFLDGFVPKVFPGERPYYFEHTPNVRFHIPYDIAAPYKKQYDKFAKKHGQGKIAPHGPHRDSWLDCPDNVVNIWIAIGPVVKGNGLSVFADDHSKDLPYLPNGEIAEGVRLSPPLSFDLAPGDVLLFHSDQLHASELNRTNTTRFAVSFRVSFGKPNFPNGHYHFYDYSKFARGGLRPLAGVPANLQWSYFSYRINWLKKKLLGDKSKNSEPAKAATNGKDQVNATEDFKVNVADVPVGTIHPVSSGVCVARTSEDEFYALSRRCPHKGADMTEGFVCDGQVVCPWHNLHFDPKSGKSDCETLKPLRSHECQVDGDQVIISRTATKAAKSTEAESVNEA